MVLCGCYDLTQNCYIDISVVGSKALYCSKYVQYFIKTRKLSDLELRELGTVDGSSIILHDKLVTFPWNEHLNPAFLAENLKIAGMSEKEIDEYFKKNCLEKTKE